MLRFWIAIRSCDCQAPENGTPVFNSKRSLYTCTTYEKAVELAKEKTETEGGQWLVFGLSGIVTAEARTSTPETP